MTPEELGPLLGIPLSEEQVIAATAPMEPGVIVAGAGTGKTTVMAARVVWLVASGQVAPDAVLGLTFTTKAAGQLLSRVRASLQVLGGAGKDDAGDPQVSTYHSFAARVVDEFGLRIGIDPGSAVLSAAARVRLAHRIACRREVAPVGDAALSTVVNAILRLDDTLADHGVEPQALMEADAELVADLQSCSTLQRTGESMLGTSLERQDLADLVLRFREAKSQAGVVDFADQIRLAEAISRESAEVSDILRDRHRVVLLDEYQDTSVSQRQVMAHLFGGGHPVTAVGDPCQAIYGWRGASVRNIDMFDRHFPRADGKPAARFDLAVNRRSRPLLLAAANRASAPLRRVHGVRPLTAAEPEGEQGQVRCALLSTIEDEITWVADEVAALGPRLEGDWRSVAILSRASAGLWDLAQALIDRGVPAQVVGATALLDRPEVAEVRSILEVLHDPAANPAHLRILMGPRWRIGTRDLAALARHAATRTRRTGGDPGRSVRARLGAALEGLDPVDVAALSEAVDDVRRGVAVAGLSEEARERLTVLGAEMRDLRRHLGEPVVDLVHRVLAVTGLDVELAASPAALTAQAREAMASFIDLTADFRDLDGRADLGAFLAHLRDADRWGSSPEATLTADRNAVTLMTVHKSKGLEYPVVVLPFLCTSVFPSAQGRGLWPTSSVTLPESLTDDQPTPVEFGDDEAYLAYIGFPELGDQGPRAKDHVAYRAAARRLDLLEETRLAYVALTRAERMIIATGHHWGPGQKTARGPGDYLEAVRAVCRESGGEAEIWAPAPEEGQTNPLLSRGPAAVEAPGSSALARRRRAAADDVLAAMADVVTAADLQPPAVGARQRVMPALSETDAVRVAQWDRDLWLLEQEAAEPPTPIRIPTALTASQVLDLARDPELFRRRLRRPLPRPPAPAARWGVQFHAWVEALLATRSGSQLSLLEPDDLPGAADEDIRTPAELLEMRDRFLALPYAELAPVAVEAPFVVRIGERIVRGRIDAVFRIDGSDEVIDWKTGRSGDPLQLAIYRLAWAERQGLPLEQVGAAFVMVRTGEVVRPIDLPGRAELEVLLAADGDG